jgi:hypothetical protein
LAIGKTNIDTVAHVHDAAVLANYKYIENNSSLAKIQRDAAIARETLEASLNALNMEMEYVNKKISFLSIKAPIDGKLDLHVRSGTPVSLGFVLGTIE